MLIVVALVAGGGAGIAFHTATARVAVVVAARDLDASKPLSSDDVTMRELPPDAIPDGVVLDASRAVGRIPRVPVVRGQLLFDQTLADDAATFRSGLVPPSGYRAIALPVGPAQALGGAIAAGSRVDVVAVPVAGRAPAGRTTELLATGALVLDVRTESGGAFGAPAAKGAAVAAERIGSVVIAIHPSDELRFADRIATSTIVIAFVRRP